MWAKKLIRKRILKIQTRNKEMIFMRGSNEIYLFMISHIPIIFLPLSKRIKNLNLT